MIHGLVLIGLFQINPQGLFFESFMIQNTYMENVVPGKEYFPEDDINLGAFGKKYKSTINFTSIS